MNKLHIRQAGPEAQFNVRVSTSWCYKDTNIVQTSAERLKISYRKTQLTKKVQHAQIDASKDKTTYETFKENANTCKTTTKTPFNVRDTQKTEAKSTKTETK